MIVYWFTWLIGNPWDGVSITIKNWFICEEKNDPVQPQVCTAHDIWFGNCKVLVVVTTDLRLYNAFSHFIKLILGQEKPYDWM